MELSARPKKPKIENAGAMDDAIDARVRQLKVGLLLKKMSERLGRAADLGAGRSQAGEIGDALQALLAQAAIGLKPTKK